MSHPTTCAKNANQHPGHIILEGKQKQCTSEQKQANDTEVERAQGEQETAQEHEEESQLTNPPKPKPRLHLIINDPSQDSAYTMKSVFGDDDRVESNMTILVAQGKLVGADEAIRIADQHSMDSQKWKPDSSWYEVFPSLSMLTTMILLTKTILFYWDCIDSSLEADKSKYSGVGDVVDWADKLASSKPLHTLLSQCSASNSHYAWLVSSMGMGSQIKVQAPPTSTCSSSHPATPMINNPPGAGTCDDDSPYIQGSDTGEHLAMSHPSAKTIHQRMNAMWL
ncbi:hypothetical protein F5141DRAFT_1063216 [Pisolithus sp. B1]|nr:hypothetical protein F5141DRAFT_1063216 [Pisolithus sp. B1]